MIGIDTNVLLRYLLDDDPAQSAAARRFFESLTPQSPGVLCHPVLVETWWVLRSRKIPPAVRITTFEALLEAAELKILGRSEVREALQAAGRGADFADALIERTLAASGCGQTVTFDAGAISNAGMVSVDHRRDAYRPR